MFRNWFPLLALTLAPLLWAGNFTAARAVHELADPLWLNSARWVLASLALSPLLWRDRQAVRAEIRRHPVLLVVLALLGIVGSNTMIYCGLQHASATQVGVVYGLTPFLILLLSRLAGGGRFDPKQGYGGLAAFAGVCFILTGGDMSQLQQEASLGALLVLGGGTLWALYTLLLRRVSFALAPMTLVALLSLIGALLMAPVLVLRPLPGGADSIAAVLPTVLFLGLGGSALAYSCWGQAVTHLGACQSGLALQLMPVFGAVLGCVLLGEVPTLAHLIGIALVLLGLMVACQPGLGSARAACQKAAIAQGLAHAPRHHHPQNS